MRRDNTELKKIESMLREIREAETYIQHGPEFVELADRIFDVLKKYDLKELHAWVRGAIYGL
jgi:hypothetical protein